MDNYIEFIQPLMKYQKENVKVDIILDNDDKLSGFIDQFYGRNIAVNGVVITIKDIKELKELKNDDNMDLSEYLWNRVVLSLKSGEEKDAVLIAYDNDCVTYITDQGQLKTKLDEMVKITCNEEETIIDNSGVLDKKNKF